VGRWVSAAGCQALAAALASVLGTGTCAAAPVTHCHAHPSCPAVAAVARAYCPHLPHCSAVAIQPPWLSISCSLLQVPAFLADSSRLFEEILAAEDAMDGQAVEGILQRVS